MNTTNPEPNDRAGGLEGSLSGMGKFLFVLGGAGCIAGFLVPGDAAQGRSALGIVLSVASLVHGIAAFYFFRGLAEAIRLLKKMAGLPYGGTISEPYEIFKQEEDA